MLKRSLLSINIHSQSSVFCDNNLTNSLCHFFQKVLHKLFSFQFINFSRAKGDLNSSNLILIHLAITILAA